MAYIFDLSDAWSGGAAFTAIKMNVTDGGSTAGSLLMDLQVGGVSRFSVRKDGATFIPSGNVYNTSTPNLSFGTSGWGMMATAYGLSIRGANDGYLTIAPNFTISSTSFFGWSSAAGAESIITGADTRLYRDAANTLAQRNGVNAQAFNLYNTYTDASNYERGFMRWTGNLLQIGAEAAGTGTARTLRFFNTATTQLNMTIDPAGATVGLTREGLNYIRATNVVSGALALGTSISGGRVDSIVVTGTAVEIREDIVLMANLPTSNPAVAGQLWNDAGTLKVSAG